MSAFMTQSSAQLNGWEQRDTVVIPALKVETKDQASLGYTVNWRPLGLYSKTEANLEYVGSSSPAWTPF